MANTPFKLKSGNTTPFKMMGSSPLRQDYVKNIYHAKFNPSGTINKPITKTATTNISKQAVKKTIGGTLKTFGKKALRFLGSKALATAGMYFGSMSASKADQPGPEGKSKFASSASNRKFWDEFHNK